jgi:2-dehydro-3-deoxyphosphooctonate aldolase (KDO 8-P synthase)
MKLLDFEIGLDRPFFLIAGPCVVESEQLQIDTAGTLKEITSALGIPFIFKSSFDKANRSSDKSFRGPGMDEGLRILSEVKRQLGVPLLTDVHEYTPFDEVAAVVDVLQTPAFLCRQTDFIQAVARTMKPVNIKKGQFLAPWDMKHVVEKARAVGNEQIMVCERGASFGYNNLVSDMRSLVVMRETGCPVVFDATHSVQLPGGQGASSGGQREFVPALSRAAVAVGHGCGSSVWPSQGGVSGRGVRGSDDRRGGGGHHPSGSAAAAGAGHGRAPRDRSRPAHA